MKLAKSRVPVPRVRTVRELGARRNNLEIGTAITTPFKTFFADGYAATATWPNMITDMEQVNSD